MCVTIDTRCLPVAGSKGSPQRLEEVDHHPGTQEGETERRSRELPTRSPHKLYCQTDGANGRNEDRLSA